MQFLKNGVKLESDDEFTIDNNLVTFEHRGTIYSNVKFLELNNSVLEIEELNYSYPFLIPIIFNKNYNYEKDYLVNTYTGYNATDKEHVYFKYWKGLTELEKRFLNHVNFVENIDIDDNFVIYKFEVPKNWQNDYELLLDGKYSKISRVGRSYILGYIESEFNESKPFFEKVFMRDISLKKKIETEINQKLSIDAELYAVLKEDLILTL